MIDKYKYKVGDLVVITTDHSTLIGAFEIGTIVEVIEQNEFGYSIKDKYGNKLNDIGWVI